MERGKNEYFFEGKEEYGKKEYGIHNLPSRKERYVSKIKITFTKKIIIYIHVKINILFFFFLRKTFYSC